MVMNSEQYVALRRIELLVLQIQRAELELIKKRFHMLNHTAFNHFKASHLKAGQFRLVFLRIAYYRTGWTRRV